jgi:hypothetical protein
VEFKKLDAGGGLQAQKTHSVCDFVAVMAGQSAHTAALIAAHAM